MNNFILTDRICSLRGYSRGERPIAAQCWRRRARRILNIFRKNTTVFINIFLKIQIHVHISGIVPLFIEFKGCKARGPKISLSMARALDLIYK